MVLEDKLPFQLVIPIDLVLGVLQGHVPSGARGPATPALQIVNLEV